MEGKKNFLTIGEASKYLGVSIDTLRRWEKKGKINAYRSPGGHRYFRKTDLENLFGTKYERDETTKRQSLASEINLTEGIIPQEQKQEDQGKSYFKDKLSVPRYIKREGLLKFEKLLQPVTPKGSALGTQSLIQTSSILQPLQDRKIDKPLVETKKTILLTKTYLFLIGILALISLTILILAFLQKPNILSPIP